MSLQVTLITLLAFLITRELASTIDTNRAQNLSKFLVIAIIPLAILSIVFIALRMIEIAI